MKYEYVIFDLDGTLTDSQEGITNCVLYALERCLGIKEVPYEELLRFIGPPLKDSFMEFYQMSESDAIQAAAVYRERYSVIGWKENRVYEGMEDCLKRLKQAGVKLGVATSKPTEYTENILQYFQIREYFDVVCGARMDGAHSTKKELIERALMAMLLMHQDVAMNVDPSSVCEQLVMAKNKTVMVGDRKFDLDGALDAGVDSIGVLYGFGEREELVAHQATYLAVTPYEVWRIIEGEK